MRLLKKFGFIFLCLILGFIIINSLLDGEISCFISNLPRRFIQLFIPFGKYRWLDEFLIHKIRKFAHFFEYFVLGLFLTGFYLFKKRTLNRLLKTAYILFSVAFFDETIQIFSNRQSKISDIWIDLFGALFGMFFLKIVDIIIKSFKKHILNIKVKKNDKD